jgi:hypothetical protein
MGGPFSSSLSSSLSLTFQTLGLAVIMIVLNKPEPLSVVIFVWQHFSRSWSNIGQICYATVQMTSGWGLGGWWTTHAMAA